ncbi:Voltage-gated potassium channel subunit beta, partial [Globisporangium splendens]
MASSTPVRDMKYRYLGNSGLLVSTFSFGCMTFDNKSGVDKAYDIMVKAFQSGINFFDNAESYNGGEAEQVMGQAIQRGIDNGVWTREDLVIGTKVFFGQKSGPNDQGISRKHVIEGVKGSLKRTQLEYLDVLYCHRPEATTPIEETVRAMNYVIQQGWAFYWGTSEWTSADIIEACEIADHLGLIRPVVEQTQYSIFERSRVEFDYVNLYKKYKLGAATWSPLAFGVLTGKYSQGIPEGSRMNDAWLSSLLPDFELRVGMANKIKLVADEVGCSLAQLAIAWCASNQNVSSVILGASSAHQLEENIKAHAFIGKITPEIKARIDAIVQFVPKLAEHDEHSKVRAHHV